MAAELGRLEIAETLIAHDATIDSVHNGWNTKLMLAACCGMVE